MRGIVTHHLPAEPVDTFVLPVSALCGRTQPHSEHLARIGETQMLVHFIVSDLADGTTWRTLAFQRNRVVKQKPVRW